MNERGGDANGRGAVPEKTTDDSGPRAWKLLRDVIQPNTLPMVIVLEKELAAISMRPGDDVKPMPSIPWNGKTPTAATAAAAKATAGGDATAPNDGVLEAIKKVQQQQRHGEVLAGVDASAAWAKASSRSELLLSQAAAIS
ncbi:hypothetical protein CLOM_g7350 [Closterium sp. NIES-68]|nr:hypothetical protein CLOM_g7350 [Closterium sp. NIES-68]